MQEKAKKKGFLISSVLFALILTCPFAYATDIYVDPSNQTVWLGDTVSVDISISDVNDLFGYEFVTTYNPSVLSLVSVTEGPFFDTWLGTISPAAYGLFFPGDTSIPGQIGSGSRDSVSTYRKWLRAYRSVVGDVNYNPEVDFNGNGAIDLEDFLYIRRNYTDDTWEIPAGSITPISSGVNGSGTLATLTFKAIDIGTSPISLYDVVLSDYYGSAISTSVSSGSVTVTPEPLSSILFLSGGATLAVRAYRMRRKQGT